MLKKLFVTISLTLMFLTACSGCSFTPPYKSVDRIELRLHSISMGSATAFAVGDDLLLTAGHVCDTPLLKATSENGGFDVVKIDAFYDLCLLRGAHSLEPLELASQNALIGDKVYVLGYPEGILNLTEGYVSYKTTGMTVLSVPVYFGNSGSPVLNESGEVVGLSFAKHKYYDNMSFMVPLNEVKRFLRTADRRW